jgi:hypothetical protein
MQFWSKMRQYFFRKPDEPSPVIAPSNSDSGSPSIGVAWMEWTGTVYVRIRLEGPNGLIGDVNLRYTRWHRRYRDIVACLGGLTPGQSKVISSFDIANFRSR